MSKLWTALIASAFAVSLIATAQTTTLANPASAPGSMTATGNSDSAAMKTKPATTDDLASTQMARKKAKKKMAKTEATAKAGVTAQTDTTANVGAAAKPVGTK